MDAEIRRLTYVPRYGGSVAWSSIPGAAAPPFGERVLLPGRDLAAKPSSKIPDVRLETRILELERERSEAERRHREELAAVQEHAAEARTAALREQKERLEQDYASPLRAAVALFQQEQKRYFREAESAVVRLALGIAARVLHREAQLDPLLLRGPVRVALEDAQQSATCVLEVAASQAEMWRSWLSAETSLARVQIRGKEDAPAGHCRVEIGPSVADLSVHAQLTEIERGFFDLLDGRPVTVEGKQE